MVLRRFFVYIVLLFFKISTNKSLASCEFSIEEKKFDLRHEELAFTKTLGSGAFSDVKLAYSRTRESYIAVKILFLERIADHEVVSEKERREIFLENFRLCHQELKANIVLSSKGHPNIVKFLGFWANSEMDKCQFVFEDGGVDLWQLMQSKSPRRKFEPNLRACFTMISELISGLRFIHDNDFIHGDLKPQNLLLTESNILKISDFGLAHHIEGPYSEHGLICTLWYRAPELLLGGEEENHCYEKSSMNQGASSDINTVPAYYDQSIDIWSLALIFFEIMSTNSLLTGNSEFDQLIRIFSLCGTPNEQSWPGVSSFPYFNPDFPRWQGSRVKEELDSQIIPHWISRVKNNSDEISLIFSFIDFFSKILILDPRQRPNIEKVSELFEEIENLPIVATDSKDGDGIFEDGEYLVVLSLNRTRTNTSVESDFTVLSDTQDASLVDDDESEDELMFPFDD